MFRSIRRGGHVTANRLSPESVARLVKRYSQRAGLRGIRADRFGNVHSFDLITHV